MTIPKLFLGMILLFTGATLSAQGPFVQHFRTSEGLPSNLVHKVYQDSKKFIWFTTDAGVARYDGTKFVYYRMRDGLSSNDIVNIKEDSSGRIWFFHTNAPLNYLQNNKIFNEKNTPFLDSLQTNVFFNRFYEDKERNIYFFAKLNRLIYCLDNQNRVSKFNLPSIPIATNVKPRHVESMNILDMYKNASGEFMFLTAGGIYSSKKLSGTPVNLIDSLLPVDAFISADNSKYFSYRKKGDTDLKFKRFKPENDLDKMESLPQINSKLVNNILEDSSGLLWYSSYDQGVFCFGGGKLIYHFDIDGAVSIIQDNENNIWVSSLKDGVYKISPFFQHKTHYDTGQFENSGINGLFNNDTLGVWCTNGKMAYLLRNHQFYKLDFQQSEKSLDQILQIDSKTLFIWGTNKLPFVLVGVHVDDVQNRISFDRVNQSPAMMKKIIYNKQTDRISAFDPNILFLPDRNTFFKKNMVVRRFNDKILNLYYNLNNELVANSKKVYIVDEKVKKEYKELSYFNKKQITDHLNLKDSELFNIEGDSLFILKNKKLYNLSAAFEQPIDLQMTHMVYHDSTLFIATSRNIFVCNKPLNVLENKPVTTFIVNLNFKSINDIVFHDNQLYVASDEGLTAIPHSDLQISRSFTPIPYFQSIQVNDTENQVEKGMISLKSNQRINISFGCINYSISPIVFSYKLEATDDNWTIVKGNNVVLQNLSKGKYLFELRARKAGSPWSEPVKFGIEVQAPFWQHPLLIFLVVFVIGGVAFLFVVRRKNIELDRRQKENQIILLEQKSLQAMMNPHFIFNTLGSIQNYLLHNQPYEAGIYLSQFARLIRQNLSAVNTSMINLEEEVDRLKNYLDLEKLRLGNKFDYTTELDEALESEDMQIPSMIIQPFVENAIWHGIANLDEHGIISINLKLIDEKSILVTVSDTGIGMINAKKYNTKSEEHLKLGMNITRKRLLLLCQKYGVKSEVIYAENTPGSVNPGTKVTIIVPFIYGNRV